jgi:hypothetical protein
MLLSKIKITTCAAALMLLAGVGASGLTYRATAQTPRPKETLASQSQTDELEALRLEIEALRKSLQATRERVKSLEVEVSALKGQRQGPQGAGKGGRPGNEQAGTTSGIQGGPPGQAPYNKQTEGVLDPTSGIQGGPPGLGVGGQPQGSSQGSPVQGMKRGMMGGTMKDPNQAGQGQLGTIHGGGGMRPKAKSDPVTEAENALKKLKENPGDKQATEFLERALQRLKERDKQNSSGETPNR